MLSLIYCSLAVNCCKYKVKQIPYLVALPPLQRKSPGAKAPGFFIGDPAKACFCKDRTIKTPSHASAWPGLFPLLSNPLEDHEEPKATSNPHTTYRSVSRGSRAKRVILVFSPNRACSGEGWKQKAPAVQSTAGLFCFAHYT